jgi:hypothetical protein
VRAETNAFNVNAPEIQSHGSTIITYRRRSVGKAA